MSYDYVIYLTICEELVNEFDKKHTKYGSFPNYCVGLGYSISDNNLNYYELNIIKKIISLIIYLFALDVDTASNYLSMFLEKDNIIEYERSVRLTNEHFGLKS